MKISLLLFGLLSVTLYSEEINLSTPMDKVEKLMKQHKYEETYLSRVARKPKEDKLKFWVVGEGILIMLFEVKSKKAKSIHFYLTDSRPKSTRKEYELKVESFNPENGKLTIQTAKE